MRKKGFFYGNRQRGVMVFTSPEEFVTPQARRLIRSKKSHEPRFRCRGGGARRLYVPINRLLKRGFRREKMLHEPKPGSRRAKTEAY